MQKARSRALQCAAISPGRHQGQQELNQNGFLRFGVTPRRSGIQRHAFVPSPPPCISPKCKAAFAIQNEAPFIERSMNRAFFLSVKPCVGGGICCLTERACEMPACEYSGSIICEGIAVDVIMNLPQKSDISHIPPRRIRRKSTGCVLSQQRTRKLRG